MKKLLSFLIISLITLFIGYYFSLFNRFNYLTGVIDTWRGSPRIATYGELEHPCGVPCIGLKEKYGFHESYRGCNVSNSEIRGIKAYNAIVEKHLEKINGKNWRKEYQTELNGLIKQNRLE